MTPSPKPQCNNILTELLSDATWRIFRIMAEFVDGFQFLSEQGPSITIFGSARTPEGHRSYEEARRLGALLAKEGVTIVTGGGPGIMEAANRGAFDENGHSIGLNIELPFEQRANKYITKGIGFHYFFSRKVMLSISSLAYVYFPGGFGTLDELFEIVTLIQTKKMSPLPVVLVGRDFWEPLKDWIVENMQKKHKYISQGDENLLHIVDSADEAYRYVMDKISMVCELPSKK